MATSELIKQFIDMTGASSSVATFYLDSAKGDLMQALNAFFESGGEEADGGVGHAAGAAAEDEDDAPGELSGDSDDEDMAPHPSALDAAEAAAKPRTFDDMMQSMFEKAEANGPRESEADGKEKKGKQRSVFSGAGYSLGNTAGPDNAPGPAAAPQAGSSKSEPPKRPDPRVHKVTVWKDNVFQLDDGPLRFPTEEVNKKFLETLAKGWVPEELRSVDDLGRPVPVNISLADRREEPHSNAEIKKPKFQAFGGGGNVLGKDWTSEAYGKVAAATAAGGGPAGPAAVGSAAAPGAAGGRPQPPPAVDAATLERLRPAESEASTVIQVRQPGSGARLEAKLRRSGTVGDLRRWVTASGIAAAGAFDIMAGFPPRPLAAAADARTLEEEGLVNAAVTLRLR